MKNAVPEPIMSLFQYFDNTKETANEAELELIENQIVPYYDYLGAAVPVHMLPINIDLISKSRDSNEEYRTDPV